MGLKESGFAIKVSAGSVADYSDGKFTIKMGSSNPTLSVSSPVAGSVYSVGTTVPVKWSPYDTNQSLRFSLLRKSDASFLRWINVGASGTGGWAWTIPSGLSGNDYYVRVETHNNAVASGVGYSGVFTIVAQTTPSITVISPNGGEVWQIGSVQTIRWSGGNTTDRIRIILDTSPNFAYDQITNTDMSNTGSYSWIVPNAIAKFYVRVCTLTSSGLVNQCDTSDSPFSTVAGTQASTIPSPIAHWKFDEGSGTTASDSSGNGNNGTLANGPLWVTGKSGRALQFDKIDDMVSVNAPTAFDNLPQVTVTAWINPKSTGEGALGRIADKSDTTSPDRGWIFYLTGTNQLSFMADFTSTNLSKLSSALTLNQWQHVAVTWDGTSSASGARLYVNGNEVTYATNQSGSGTRVLDDVANLYIGNNKSGARTFDGDIDDVRIFNRVLTSQEVNQVMQVGSGAYDSERDRKLAEIQNELFKLNASIMLFLQSR